MSYKPIFLIIVIITIPLIAVFFMLRGWPMTNTCQRDLSKLQVDGSWLYKQEGTSEKRIMLIRDSFMAFDLIEGVDYNGQWQYLNDGFIRFTFTNPNEKIKELLQKIINDYPKSDNYRNIDVDKAIAEIRVKFNDTNCDMSNPFFYIANEQYRRGTFEDWQR